jgi:hypothetical protein
MDIAYKLELKFLGIHITDNLRWSAHVHTLSLKLSRASYLIKSLKEIMGPSMMRSIYYSKFQALLRYGIIFWGADNESIPTFKLQKRVIRIMGGVGTGTSCRQLFQGL